MASSLLAGLSILIIGDSHMATPNYLIGGLHDDLIRKGANVHSIGICGANASDWLKASPGGACGAAERRGKAPAVILRGKASTTPIKELIAKDKPDLVLRNGTVRLEGTGGNHTYQFKSGPYRYECVVTVLGEWGVPTGVLVVYKNDVEIMSQPVIKVL